MLVRVRVAHLTTRRLLPKCLYAREQADHGSLPGGGLFWRSESSMILALGPLMVWYPCNQKGSASECVKDLMGKFIDK